MLALFANNVLPSFCPNCGASLALTWGAYSTQDYIAGASFECLQRCGLSYAGVETSHLLEAATTGGSDLERMLRLAGQ